MTNSFHKIAVIDLGTNTFQLGIAQIIEGKFKYLLEKSLAPKLGKGGISDGKISEEAISRAIEVLMDFIITTKSYGIYPQEILAFGTSAIRNANNGVAFCKTIKQDLGININIIDGNKEAELIYEGVKYAIEFNEIPYLIMDIGGGSVEFIIANYKNLYWKQSFEIGGQRLMDMFFDTDPIAPNQVRKLQNYLSDQLIPLMNAIHQYSPKTLVGSAGSFETLVDIYNAANSSYTSKNQSIASQLPIESFYDSYYKFLEFDRNQRMAIPGMIELRVDMIVVATVLIDYIIKTCSINEIFVSNYALKEGVLAKFCKNEPII
jgi:exopolyphosphatase / guanosine-5'-triphosphate,3'-diphosphate pyrophosphatase